MEAITLPIYNVQGQEIDQIKLDTAVFDGNINKQAIYQAVNAYLANQRKGLAATKTRGEVSGGGRKPWRQKGTGRARVGSTRSPLWRHGGVVFGPHPRDFSFVLPRKIKSLALKSSLNAKVKENNFIVVDTFKTETSKTKEAAKIFSDLKVNSGKGNARILLLLDKIDGNLKLSLDNLDFLSFNLAKDTHVYEVLAAQKLLITKDALSILTKRIKG
ncbi:50S ribosomal protein L4 [bacterium]|nr:MAG: 50S ribosomal protein L4 [bacterium]